MDYTLRTPGTYTAEQVNTLVSTIFGTLREEISPEQRSRVIKKLDSLLLAMAD